MTLTQKIMEHIDSNPKSFAKKCADSIRQRGLNSNPDDRKCIEEASKTHPEKTKEIIDEKTKHYYSVRNDSGYEYE